MCRELNDILRHCICSLVKLDICFKRMEFNEAQKIVLLSKLQGSISFFSPTFLKNKLDQLVLFTYGILFRVRRSTTAGITFEPLWLCQPRPVIMSRKRAPSATSTHKDPL